MDKEEFTPGPWKVSEGLETFYEDCLKGLAVTTDEGPVCHVWDAYQGRLPYEANAALIAAAPAMYTLLNMIQKILPIEGDENARIAFLLTQIRQVLMKARGEK